MGLRLVGAHPTVPMLSNIAVHAQHLKTRREPSVSKNSIELMPTISAHLLPVCVPPSIDVVERQEDHFCFPAARTSAPSISVECLNSEGIVPAGICFTLHALVSVVVFSYPFRSFYSKSLSFIGDCLSLLKNFFSILCVVVLCLRSLRFRVAKFALPSSVEARATEREFINWFFSATGFAHARSFVL